jgi:hypothetical protein
MKHVTFSLSLILGLALFAWLTASAWAAYNLATDLCTSCTTAAQFQAYAQSNIPSGAYFETTTGPKMEVEFLIFNPGASLAAAISVHGSCLSTADGAPCSWDMTWIEETGSTTDMEQYFEELAPSLAIAVPPSVAPTFTGTSQASAVSAWLAQETAGVVAPLGADVLTVFPDGSSAEYTVTGTNPTAYGFVSGSGHAADGDPENDSGELVGSVTYTQLTPAVGFNIKSLIQATNAQEAAADHATIGSPSSLKTTDTVSLQSALNFATSIDINNGYTSVFVSLWCMTTGKTCPPASTKPKGT